MKTTMYVGDLHGDLYNYEKAIEKFEQEKFDKLVFIGDYVDSYDSTDVEVLHLLKEIILYKDYYHDSVVLLLGNHDIQYIYNNKYSSEYRCSGFRPHMYDQLHKLFNDNLHLFQIAYKDGNDLATHAGVLSTWFKKYETKLEQYAISLNLDLKYDIDKILNAINKSEDRWILHEVGTIRGGLRGDYGGITWADKGEFGKYFPLDGYHHICGHNRVDKIEEKKYGNSSIVNLTYIDCLRNKTDFLVTKT